MTCAPHRTINPMVKSRTDGLGLWHVRGRGEVYTRFWWGKPYRKRPLIRRRRTWDHNIKTDFQ